MTDPIPRHSPNRQPGGPPVSAEWMLNQVQHDEFCEAPTTPPRHPQPVSGSISPSEQVPLAEGWMLNQVQHDEFSSINDGAKTEANSQVMPVGIFALDQIDLPFPMPAFEPLFAQHGAFHVAEHLEADEAVNAVAARKSFDRSGTVLPQSRDEIARYAGVECSVSLAGGDIDTGVTLERHNRHGAEIWTVKQVQGDGITKSSLH